MVNPFECSAVVLQCLVAARFVGTRSFLEHTGVYLWLFANDRTYKQLLKSKQIMQNSHVTIVHRGGGGGHHLPI